VIKDCLASVARQTFPAEHLVIDGLSTDGTVEVLSDFAGPPSTLSWISEPDGGIYDAMNKGIALAKGDVIGFLHADDFYAGPRVLARLGVRGA